MAQVGFVADLVEPIPVGAGTKFRWKLIVADNGLIGDPLINAIRDHRISQDRDQRYDFGSVRFEARSSVGPTRIHSRCQSSFADQFGAVGSRSSRRELVSGRRRHVLQTIATS